MLEFNFLLVKLESSLVMFDVGRMIAFLAEVSKIVEPSKVSVEVSEFNVFVHEKI